MTHKEFFEKVITLASNDKEVCDFASAELGKIAIKNAKAKEKRIADMASNEPIFKGIREYLSTHKVALASELATACGISTPKAVAMAKKMASNGEITEKTVKIAKVGDRKAYSLVKVEPTEESASNEVEALDRELTI